MKSNPTAPNDLNLDLIENTLIKFSDQLIRLTEEIAFLKNEILTTPKQSNKGKSKESKESLEYGDLLKRSREAMIVFEKKLEEMERRTLHTTQQSIDIDDKLKQTRSDLEKWYNSAFFSDDSKRIKDIHDLITSVDLDRGPNRPGQLQNNIPLSEELSRYVDAEQAGPAWPHPSRSGDQKASTSGCEAYPQERTSDIRPFEICNGVRFTTFNAQRMNESTVFDTKFQNRATAYYGSVPYKYGKTVHKPRPFSDNPYLQELFAAAKTAIPDLVCNSALITKYEKPDSCIPKHSDDEKEIVEDSQILTISLGQHRELRFHRKDATKEIHTFTVNHGDAFMMSRKSQNVYSHELLPSTMSAKDHSVRISVTFRLLKSVDRPLHTDPGRGRSRGRSRPVVGYHEVPPPASLGGTVLPGRRQTYINKTNAVTSHQTVHRSGGASSMTTKRNTHFDEFAHAGDRRDKDRSTGIRRDTDRSARVRKDTERSEISGSHRTYQAPLQPRKIYVTALITDSIMRKLPEDALGTNHELHMMHRRYASALNDDRKEDLVRLQPDFIYVHLGINDLLDGTKPRDLLLEYKKFERFIHDRVQKARIIFSVPLLTDRDSECRSIKESAQLMHEHVIGTEGNRPTLERKTHLSRNSNFRTNSWAQRTNLFNGDGIHLNKEGLSLILSNFRYYIHFLTRKIKAEEGTRRLF